jgi:hypothetical protein
MNDWLVPNRLSDCSPELPGGEAPHDGDDSIVAANGMKSKGKRCQPESCCGDPASPYVAHDHAHSRYAIHFAKQCERIFSGEMVQHLRTHHHFDAVIREWEPQRVGAHC